MEKKLLDRMLENYTDILDFVNRSRVPLSFGFFWESCGNFSLPLLFASGSPPVSG
jgi:hypothetical protein